MRTGPTDPEIDRLSAKGRTCDHDMSLTLIVEGRVVDVCSECGVSQDVIDLRARLATAENVVAEVQMILAAPELWEERVRRALALVTEYLTRPGTEGSR